MTILVTGGPGYIGSHMVHAFVDAGEQAVMLDNLTTDFDWAAPPSAKLAIGDAGDQPCVAALIAQHRIDAVLHFAASIVVPDSVRDPLGCYRNNTMNSRALIETALKLSNGSRVLTICEPLSPTRWPQATKTASCLRLRRPPLKQSLGVGDFGGLDRVSFNAGVARGPCGMVYWRPPSHGTFATKTPAHLKTFLAIKPAQLLVVHDPPLADQKDVKPSIAKPTANGGELAQAGPYRRIVRRAAVIAHRRSSAPSVEHARRSLTSKRDPKLSDGLSSGGGRHHLFAAISLSIALSSIASAKSFFSFVFSSSSARSRWRPKHQGHRTWPSTCRTSRC
jgi:hypothetical protein